MSFPRYPAYKDSDVVWLGDIPSHWEVKPLKWVIARNDGGVWGNDPTGEDDTVVLRSTEQTVDGRWQLDEPALRSLSDTEKVGSLLATGDLLVTKSSGSALHIGKTTLVTPEVAALGCYYSNFMQRIRLKPEFNSRLAWYLMNNEIARTQFDLLSNSTTGLANLNGTMLGELVAPIPSPDEQTVIVSFLDRETAKIDALVAEQEQLITLLKEKRQAVISHAVTKGLDPSVPMKDSGVEWLGEVPEHWRVSALSYLSSIETGSTPDRGEPRYWNGSIPWLKTGEINWDPIREAEEFITEEGLANSAVKLSRPGTLLMAMYGQGVTRGRVAILEIEATYNQACAAITFGDQVVPEFGRYFFMAAYDHIREGGNETSQMNLSAGLIAKFRLTVPPKTEQEAIVQKLDDELSRLNILCGEAEKAVSLLQERRSALISAAVTGQIDVRSLAAAQEQAA